MSGAGSLNCAAKNVLKNDDEKVAQPQAWLSKHVTGIWMCRLRRARF